jgi:endonuclease YncB( thermonuclease family)
MREAMSVVLRRLSLVPVLAMVGAAMALLASPAHAADRDCGDFATQKAAQIFFLKQGGPRSDPHRLDSEGDGVACESNPCPCYRKKTLPDGVGGSGSTGGGTAGGKTLRQRARIIKVIDGDTVRVRLGSGGRKDVRLIGIDTPEVYGGVQCGGPEASRSLKALLPRGLRVRLISDTTQDRSDRYGRLLRYVEKLSGADMNKAQVHRGWARVYVYDNTPFKRVGAYRNSRNAAAANDRGIWGLC